MTKRISKKTTILIIVALVLVAILGGIYIGVTNKYRVYLSNANDYIEEGKYDEAKEELEKAKKIWKGSKVAKTEEDLEVLIEEVNSLKAIDKLIDNEDYNGALKKLESFDSDNVSIKKEVKEKIKLCKEKLIALKESEINEHLANNNYDEAYKVIDEMKVIDKNNKNIEVINAKINSEESLYKKNKEKLNKLNSKFNSAENSIKNGNLDEAEDIINELKNEDLDDSYKSRLEKLQSSLASAKKENEKQTDSNKEKQIAQVEAFQNGTAVFNYNKSLEYVENDLGANNYEPGQPGWAFDSEGNFCMGWPVFSKDYSKTYHYCYYANGEFKRVSVEPEYIGTGIDYSEIIEIINNRN